MKKILAVFLSVAFLSVLFVGSAFCEAPAHSESAMSQDELKDGDSIFDLIVPDEAEAAPLEGDAGDTYEGNFHKGDDLPLLDSETEDEKNQEEEEKEKTIF